MERPAFALLGRRELDEARVASRRRDRENDLLLGVDRSRDRRRLRDGRHLGANLHEVRVGINRRLELDSRVAILERLLMAKNMPRQPLGCVRISEHAS